MSSLADETIESLQHWSGQQQEPSADRRMFPRHDCERTIYLEVPGAAADALKTDNDSRIVARAKNISANGIGFMMPQQLPTDELTVCLCQDDGEWLRIASQVVRLRQAATGLWEYGVKFLHRVEA